MAALTENRVTQGPRAFKTIDGLVGADCHIFLNAVIVCVGGYWVPATEATGLEGRYALAMEEVDNTGGAAGDFPIKVEFFKEKVLWPMHIDGSAPIVQATIGGDAYLLDDQTVSASSDSDGRSVFGTPWCFFERNMVTSTTLVWVEPK